MTPSNEPTKALPQGAGCEICQFTGKLLKAASPMFKSYGPEPCPCCYTAPAPLPGVTMGGEGALYNALRMSEPYSIFTVLEKLAEAADLLLDHRCYDGHGWELIDTARKIAPQIAADLRAALSLATEPHSAEVREVSEEDVERACIAAYEGAHPSPHEVINRAVRISMRAALGAYERGRK